jgi:hypothetical protein
METSYPKCIEITRVEGPTELCGITKEFFGGWFEANAWLKRQADTFPKVGYDKHDFKVTFDDGQVYSGRLDCKHFTREDNDLDIHKHILEFCEWNAGIAKNPYCGKEKYEEWMKNSTEEEKQGYKDFIKKYLEFV